MGVSVLVQCLRPSEPTWPAWKLRRCVNWTAVAGQNGRGPSAEGRCFREDRQSFPMLLLLGMVCGRLYAFLGVLCLFGPLGTFPNFRVAPRRKCQYSETIGFASCGTVYKFVA